MAAAMVDSCFATGSNSVAAASRPSYSPAAVVKSTLTAAATSMSPAAGVSFAAPLPICVSFQNSKATPAAMRTSRMATTVRQTSRPPAPDFIVLSLSSGEASSRPPTSTTAAAAAAVLRLRYHDRDRDRDRRRRRAASPSAPVFVVLSLPSAEASSLGALFESVETPRLLDCSLASVTSLSACDIRTSSSRTASTAGCSRRSTTWRNRSPATLAGIAGLGGTATCAAALRPR